MTIADLQGVPDATGHYGDFGGMFVPETLMAPLQELSEEYERAKADPEFQKELDGMLKDFCGRETPLYFAERLTEKLGGAKIYLKREDLLHTGAHKINNALGQVLIAKRLGKTRASLRRRGRVSMGWRPRRCARGSVWSVWSTWGRSIWSGRR